MVEAQDVVPIRRKSAPVDFPTSLGAIAFRLESKDLTASNNVPFWQDEIQKLGYTNNVSSTQPTNEGPQGLGVWFKNGSFLTCSNYAIAGFPFTRTQQVMIVYRSHATPGFGSIMGLSSAEFLIGIVTVPNAFGSFTPQKTWATPTPVDDVFHDIVYVGGSDPVQVYTNGVAAATVSAAGNFNTDMLGANQAAHVDTYQGDVRRIIVWTNAIAFTSTQVAGLHKFNTNEATINPALYFTP